MMRKTFILRLAALQAAADFDPAKHEYRGAIGGVTGMIRRAAEAGMLGWTPPPPKAYKPEHRRRGRAVHRAAELHDRGRLDESSVTDSLRGYVDAWESFAQQWGAEWDAIEAVLFSEDLGYGGIPDRMVLYDGTNLPILRRDYMIARGTLVVLDIKTGKSANPAPGWELQTIAYARMFGEAAARRCFRVATMLRPDGTFGVRTRDHRRNAADLAMWERVRRFALDGVEESR